MILKSLYIIYLKSGKMTLFVCVGNFVCDANYFVESLSVPSLCMFKTVRLLNRSWFILEQKACFLAFEQLKKIFLWLPDLRSSAYILGHSRNVRGLGKSMVVFRLCGKVRYSNKRSTKFESVNHE